MYNYFADEKRKKGEEMKAIEDKKAQRQKEKRHNHDFPVLVNNYERRIKNFVFEMATSKSPTLIRDYINPIESTRKQFMQEEVSKIKGRAGFLFKGFLTEKERIKEYLDKKNTIYMEKYVNVFKDDRLNESKQNDAKKFLQPTMRFKPRNDFERIYDSINSVYYGSVSKERLNRHLKTLRINDNENGEEDSSDDENIEQNKAYVKRIYKLNESNAEDRMNVYNVKSITDELKKRSFFNGNDSKYKDFKGKMKNQSKKTKRRLIDNSEARGFRKELYNKTHFKAATDLTIFKMGSSPENTMYRPIKTYETDFDKISDYNDNEETEFNNTYTTTKESDRVHRDILGKKIKETNETEDFRLITKNPLIKSINLKEEEHIDENALMKLKKMSAFSTITSQMNPNSKQKKSVHFVKNKKIVGRNFQEILTKNIPGLPTIKTDYNEEGHKKKEDEKITIDDATYLKTDVDLISKAVLKRCNYTHDKSKNAMKILKKGEGKLMFTNGMTVSEFQQKYYSISNK